MCVLDILSMKVKTGISHWRLRPTLAVIDPLLTMTLAPEVTAASGMDIVCHAVESYTARYYTTFDRKKPEERVTYCGSNPVSDLWCEKAMGLLAQSFRDAVHDGADDLEARSNMMMAATFAGMGFGNSGVHIPHANAYPIAGMVKDYRPAGYPQDEPMVPHGQSVSLTAPEAFRFSFESAPERHLKAAEMLDPRRGQAQRPAGAAAVGADPVDARHRHPQRHRRGRLHRVRRARSRARHHEAAAAAGHLPEDPDRGRHRRNPDQVHRELVTRTD